jgi:hypothetical protein
MREVFTHDEPRSVTPESVGPGIRAWLERRNADAGWNDTHLQRAASAFDDIVMS